MDAPEPSGPVWALIPAYREAKAIGDVVRGSRAHADHVLVVDDGSPDRTADVAREAGAEVIVHEVNRGKGGALVTGFRHALEQGAAAVVTLDGDGQHDPAEIPRFAEAFRSTDAAVVVGHRVDAEKAMPLIRRWTNRYMSWSISRRLGQRVPDTQCGFRLYRADVLPHLFTEAQGFAAESENLLRAGAQGFRIASVPVSTIYGEERSKIRPLRDTWRFNRMIVKWPVRRGRALKNSGEGG